MLYFLVTAPGPLAAVLQELISGDGEDYPKMQDTWVGFYRTIKTPPSCICNCFLHPMFIMIHAAPYTTDRDLSTSCVNSC